jgi:hypothetical protein
MSSTNGVNTSDWLEASKNLDMLAYVPDAFGSASLVSSQNATATVLRRAPEQLHDVEFQRQKEAFNNIPPAILEPYQGRFVAVRNGEIVDSDIDLATLTGRFFHQYGDVPVFITKVGESIQVTIHTPLFSNR